MTRAARHMRRRNRPVAGTGAAPGGGSEDTSGLTPFSGWDGDEETGVAGLVRPGDEGPRFPIVAAPSPAPSVGAVVSTGSLGGDPPPPFSRPPTDQRGPTPDAVPRAEGSAERARYERLVSFRSTYPDQWMFFDRLWVQPERGASLIDEWGDVVGLPSVDGDGDLRLFGEHEVREIAELARLMDRQRFVHSFWEHEVRKHGVRALALAEKVHAFEAHLARNVIRQHPIDLLHRTEPAPVRALIQSLLPAGALVATVGRRRSGTSLLASVDLACCVATGLPWLGRPVSRGVVLVVVLDETAEEYHERVSAWCVAHDVNRFELEKWLKPHRPPALELLAPRQAPVPAGEDDGRGAPAPDRPSGLSSLLEMINEDEPALVVIDGLRAVLGGRPYPTADEVEQVVAAMRAMTVGGRTTVMMLGPEGGGATGSACPAQFEDAVDTVVRVRRSGSARERTVSVLRNRDQWRSDPISFRLDPFGTSVAVVMGQGDVAAVHRAMRALGAPASKSTILAKVQESGVMIGREAGLQLISDLADDEDDPVERDGSSYVLSG